MKKIIKQTVFVYDDNSVVINGTDQVSLPSLWDRFDHGCTDETLLLLNLPSGKGSSCPQTINRQLIGDAAQYLLPIVSGLRAAYFINTDDPSSVKDFIGRHMEYYRNYTKSNICKIHPTHVRYPSRKSHPHPLLDLDWSGAVASKSIFFSADLPLSNEKLPPHAKHAALRIDTISPTHIEP